MVFNAYLSHPHSFGGPATVVKVTSILRIIVFVNKMLNDPLENCSQSLTISNRRISFDQRERALSCNICSRLFVYLFVWLLFISFLRIFRSCGHVSFVSERLQCLLHTVVEQGGVFIVPHLLWHGFTVSSKWLVALYDKQLLLQTILSRSPRT